MLDIPDALIDALLIGVLVLLPPLLCWLVWQASRKQARDKAAEE